MDKALERIQAIIQEGRIILTTKAIDEMDEDGFLLKVIDMEKLTECPLCGSKDIQSLTRDMQRKFQGTPYVARGIEILVCSNCDEEFVTAEMQERIESFRPEVKEKTSEEV